MLRAIWSLRLPSSDAGGVLWRLWCTVALLLVVLAPSQLWTGVPFWTMPIKGVGQTLLAATAFLLLVVFLVVRQNRPAGARLIEAGLATAACYGAVAWVILRVRPDLAYSPGELGLSVAIGATLALFPFFGLSAFRSIALAVLSSGLAVVLFLGIRPALTTVPQREVLSTALNVISVSVYSNLVGPVSQKRGGALEPYGKAFLLVTGDGDFYALDWDADGSALVSRRLPLSLPADPIKSPADQKLLTEARMARHRVIDMVLDTSVTPTTVYVSHQEWHTKDECFTVRVSVAALAETGAPAANPADAWKTVFETWPCLPMSPSFGYLEAGGRLAWLGTRLVLTVGDFQLGETVQPAPSQTDDNAYGKVLLLDRAGGHEVLSKGHRNPQGLLVDRQQRIWITEHGPQGGDEINLVQKGHNYGWPLATYGTEYGRHFWPLAPTAHDHGAFTEPVQAFLPSIGISNLIEVGAHPFSEWRGDLLVASLIGRSLFRIRLRDDRVVYIEPIPIGLRIRDIAEGADGRIALWNDAGKVMTVTAGPSEPIGSVVFAGCRSCHDSEAEREALGPSLRGIVGARVARESGYPYSPALLQLGGTWNAARLDAFLKDPNAYAPGSRMAPGQVPGDAERAALIEFLKKYK